jgi:hypothetical protein
MAISCFMLISGSILMAQDPFLAREELELSEPEPKLEKQAKKKTLNYAAFRIQSGKFCSFLLKEGHLDIWNKSVNSLLIENDSCSNCRQFLKMISCKGKADSSKVQLQPSTELLSVTSELYRDIATDSELAINAAELLIPLFTLLSTDQNKLSQTYYSILIEYIKAPLKSYLEQGQKKVEAGIKVKKRKQLETLF